MTKVVLLMLLQGMLLAAVQGQPTPPFPGPMPHIWLEAQNDNFMPGQADDNVTAAWSGGLRISNWVIGSEYSMLTSKLHKTRQDEFTITASAMLWNEDNTQLLMGGGWRTYHAMGGAKLQDKFHALIGQDPLQYRYDKHYSVPVFVVSAHHWTPIQDDSLNTRIWWRVVDTMTPKGHDLDMSAGPAADLQWCGVSTLWFGLGYYQHIGDQYCGVSDESAQKAESGFSLRMGFNLKPVEFNLVAGQHASYGSLGFYW